MALGLETDRLCEAVDGLGQIRPHGSGWEQLERNWGSQA